MVSNVLGMTDDELVERLKQLGRDHADDPEYQRLRRRLPADWPF